METAKVCNAEWDAQSVRPQSVGQVKSQRLTFNEPLALASGQTLPGYELIVETYGTLNSAHSNALLICHALTGDHHAAGYYHEPSEKPGWWDTFIGPGKPIDTRRFFVVCLNNLGGCSGSSGPLTLNPDTGVAYGPDFPMVTVSDWVNSQARLADCFGIECWAAVVGGSLGGMQALEWSIRYPHRVKHAVIIASAPKLSSQNIAFNEVARQCIVRDPEFHEGHYLSKSAYPKDGLTQARMLGHITYLSGAGMQTKFGRNTATDKLQYDLHPEFEVERYLHYQGERFCGRFDANTYLLMTKALDYFDPASAYEQDLSKALEAAQSSFLVLAFSSDWRFSPDQSVELVDALIASGKRVTYACIESDAGHDAFLLPIPRYVELLRAYLKVVADALSTSWGV